MSLSVVTSSPPPDISAIVTSLGILSLAVAAVVAGIYKGIKEIRQGGKPTGEKVAATALIETVALTALTDSNRESAEATLRLVGAVQQLETAVRDMTQDLKDNRQSIRSTSTALGDLCEIIRSLIMRIRNLENKCDG